jgi:hypothetical protein
MFAVPVQVYLAQIFGHAQGVGGMEEVRENFKI